MEVQPRRKGLQEGRSERGWVFFCMYFGFVAIILP